MPSAQKPAGAEGAERALSRDQPVAADAAAPTPANQGSASAAGAEVIYEDRQQNPLGSDDLLYGTSTQVGGLTSVKLSSSNMQSVARSPAVSRLSQAPSSAAAHSAQRAAAHRHPPA